MRALKHAYTQQLDVSIGEYFAKGSGDSREVLGQQIRVKVSKNKIAPPHRTASVDIYYTHGVDKVTELLKVAKELDVLSGTSWLKFVHPRTGEVFMDAEGKEIKFNGMAKAREALVENISHAGGGLYTDILNVVQELLYR